MTILSKLRTISRYHTRILMAILFLVVLYSVVITLKSPEPCLRDCLENMEILVTKIPFTGSLKTIIRYCRKTCDRVFPKQKTRRNVSNLTKKKVASRQNWRCVGCQELLDYTYEIDHIQPLFQGGTNHEDNLQALCPHCHRVKSLSERKSLS